MPQGCGTWPAVWEADDQVGSSAGEVDILEGVNDLSPNSVTLHTNGTCTMPDNTNSQLGYSGFPVVSQSTKLTPRLL